MILNQNILLERFPDGDSVLDIFIRRELANYDIKSSKDSKRITSEIELLCLKGLLSHFTDNQYYIIKTNEIKMPIGTRAHYFIMNKDGAILDVFAWLYSALEYEGPEVVFEVNSERANPAPKNSEVSLFSEENMPLILWTTVRAIFLNKRELSRSYKKDIAKIYKEYQKKDGSNPSQTISRIFAIAVKTLQKRGYLKEGTRQPTKLGRERSNELETMWGLDGTRSRLRHFEEILRQGRGY